MTSVTVCSTWMRGFISMKNHSLRVQIEEKFDRAGVVVADVRGDFHGGVAQLAAHGGFEGDGRGDFDDLLMAALDGAIALVQMQ